MSDTLIVMDAPPTTLAFPIATKAQYAIELSMRVGGKIRERVGVKTSVLELGPKELRVLFSDEEEYTEALRLYELVKWVKGGKKNHERVDTDGT